MNRQTIRPTLRREGLGFLAFLGLLAAIAVGGYFLFRSFVIDVTPRPESYSLLFVAVLAGTASFFSPCAFPLLPGYLSIFQSNTSESRKSTLSGGVSAALGVITFTLGLGLLIALLGSGVAKGFSISSSEPNTFVRVFRGLIGAILIALGMMQLKGVDLKPKLAEAFAYHVRPRRERSSRKPLFALYLYGLGYTAAGMGCTGPILAGLTVFALGSGGFISAASAFVVFSVTMGGLMLAISLLVAASQHGLIHRLKASAPRIKRLSALLLIVVGTFTLFSTIFNQVFVRLLFP